MRKFAAIAVGVLAGVLWLVPSLGASNTLGILAGGSGKAASGQCIPHRKVDLDHGEHDGQPWRVNASIEKAERHGRCAYWFLKVQFVPQGVAPGSWTEGWGIPAGGHLPAATTIDASEEEEGGSVGGVVGPRVRSVVLGLSGGHTLTVHPKLPSKGLRRHFVWLRRLGYFLCFVPASEHVKTAKLLDANGRVITTVHSQEGELTGSMGA